MCPIFVGSEVFRSSWYQIGAEFTHLYTSSPNDWVSSLSWPATTLDTLVSAETHQIIEPWAEAKRRVLAICWEVGFWKNRVGFRMLIYNFVTEDRSETGPWSFSEIWSLFTGFKYFIWEGRSKLTSTFTAQDFNIRSRSGFQVYAFENDWVFSKSWIGDSKTTKIQVKKVR